MASSNAFASALAESPACKSHFFASSSPDLPTVNELFKRGGLEPPPPFKVAPKNPSSPAERPTAIGSQSLSAAIQSRAGVQLPHEDENTVIEVEDISLIEIQAETFLKSKKSRGKEAPPQQSATTSRQIPAPTDGQQPWRKFKTREDINVQGQIGKQQDDGGEASVALPDTHGEPFQVSSRPKRHGQDESFNLEPAMTRRLDWTPPETMKTPIVIDSASAASRQLCPPDEPSTKAQEFEQLLQSYKCSHKMRQDVPTVSDDDCNFLKKRKLVEMVATTNGAAQVADKMAEKPKAAKKKKPRTITELATAAYRPEIDLQSKSTTANNNELPQSEKSGEVSKQGKKGPEKRTRRVARKKTTSQPGSILLPPEEALREVANQDFVFGTSSQLAVEKSPTFLRYLQAAMKESNETSIIELEGWRSSNTIEAPRTQRKLWNAGARDEDGELFDVELSNMANGSLPDMSASQEKDDPFVYLQDGRTSPAIHHPVQLPETADDDLPVAASDDHLLDASIPQRPSYDSYTDAKLAREVKSYGFKPIKSRKASIALLEKCWASKVCSSPSHTSVGGSAGFASKAGQSRGTMEPVTPEAKRRRGRPRKDKDSAGVVDPHEPPPSAQPRESPARPRGRPKKTATATATASAPATPLAGVKAKRGRPSKKPIEIPDSASEGESESEGEGESVASVKAKSPRRKKSPRKKSPSPSPSPPRVDFSSADEAGSCPGSSSQLRKTFSFVTKAVKSAPRTQDPANPSWHEKMLLYDPIILEDLTAWLNGGELSRVGCDEEVSVEEVKKWCEARSVCCLKRENLRGKERKQY